MKFCPNCGTPTVREGQAFCTECGEKFNQATSSGTVNSSSAAYNMNNQFSAQSGNYSSYGSQYGYQGQNTQYNNQYSYQKPNTQYVSKRHSIIGFVFSLVSSEFAAMSFVPFLSLFTFPAMIVFYCLALSQRNKYIREARSVYGSYNAQNGFTKATTPIAVVSFIFGILFFIFSLVILSEM